MKLDWFAVLAIASAFIVGWVACSRWMRSKYILTDRVKHLAESREYLSDFERYGTPGGKDQADHRGRDEEEG